MTNAINHLTHAKILVSGNTLGVGCRHANPEGSAGTDLGRIRQVYMCMLERLSARIIWEVRGVSVLNP